MQGIAGPVRGEWTDSTSNPAKAFCKHGSTLTLCAPLASIGKHFCLSILCHYMQWFNFNFKFIHVYSLLLFKVKAKFSTQFVVQCVSIFKMKILQWPTCLHFYVKQCDTCINLTCNMCMRPLKTLWFRTKYLHNSELIYQEKWKCMNW